MWLPPAELTSPNIFGNPTKFQLFLAQSKLFGAGVANSSALRRTLYSRFYSSTSSADLVIIGSTKVGTNFASLPYPYLSQSGKERKILSTFENKCPSRYYARDTYAMALQSPLHYSEMKVVLCIVLKGEYSKIAAEPSNGSSETTGTAVLVKNLTSPIIGTRSCTSAIISLTS